MEAIAGGVFRAPNQVTHALARAHPEAIRNAIQNRPLNLVEAEHKVRGPRAGRACAYFHPDGLTDGSTFVNLQWVGSVRTAVGRPEVER